MNTVQSLLSEMDKAQLQYKTPQIIGIKQYVSNGDILRERAKSLKALSLAQLKRRSLTLGNTGGGSLDKSISDYESKKLKYSLEKRGKEGYSDCSLGVCRVMKAAYNKDVGMTTLEQRKKGVEVSQPDYGSLIHFDNAKGGRHVGIYKGDGNMWHFGVGGTGQTVNINNYLKSNPSMSIHSYRNY